MTLDNTRARLRALRAVRDGDVKWRPDGPPQKQPKPRRSAGFAHVDGTRLTPTMLVALWELRHDHLICVEGAAVSLTVSGEAFLAERDGARAGRS